MQSADLVNLHSHGVGDGGGVVDLDGLGRTLASARVCAVSPTGPVRRSRRRRLPHLRHLHHLASPLYYNVRSLNLNKISQQNIKSLCPYFATQFYLVVKFDTSFAQFYDR